MLLHVRSISKRALDIKYVICLTETQIQMNQSVQNVISCLPNFKMHFNNSYNHYSSIAYGHQTSISCSPKADHEGFSIFKVVKKGYTSKTFTVLLLYKKVGQPLR